ncbi:MAG: ABC transporter permease [Methylothermaceae bacteria B42]|nr:MAG: ABC transporter permease [Methylothermaceae bacteria B42]HHJ38507.1 ABC transporter permease [Methylothermaceae bacterium]
MGYWTAYRTLAGKEIHRFMRIWPQTLLPPLVTTSLYFLIFGALMGPRIGPMAGIPYIDYIVPGIILMAVINHSYANVVSSFYSAKFQRHIEEMLIAPMPAWVILSGYITGGVTRGLLVGAIVTGIAAFFTDLKIAHPELAIAVALSTSVLFALGGFINAVFANSFDDISIIPNFVLTPLVYLGGVFYSITLLPEPWHSASLANPILYMVNAFRFGFLGVADVNLTTAFLMVGGLILTLGLSGLFFLWKGVGIKH